MVVLDGFALGDANIKDESRIASRVENVIENEACHITPLGLAENYMYLRNSVSTQCADAVLDMVLENKSVKVADDRDPAIIRDAIRYREDYGVHISVAFSAALAKKLGCAVLTIDKQFDELAKYGVCKVRSY